MNTIILEINGKIGSAHPRIIHIRGLPSMPLFGTKYIFLAKLVEAISS